MIELLVVMAIMAALLSLAAPRYFDSLERAKETALRTDLRMLREAIDKRRADTGRLPDNLAQLVTERYLRAIPPDPITDRSDSWVVVPSAQVVDATTEGVFDVRSGAAGTARDGSLYSSW